MQHAEPSPCNQRRSHLLPDRQRLEPVGHLHISCGSPSENALAIRISSRKGGCTVTNEPRSIPSCHPAILPSCHPDRGSRVCCKKILAYVRKSHYGDLLDKSSEFNIMLGSS
jgi:hypothetical protein